MGNFPKFRSKNQKLSISTENWPTWYIGGVDSESTLRFLKFRPQNPFLGKFGPKKSKLFVLSENWCIYYLKDDDSESGLRCLKFRPQNLFLGKFRSKKSKLSLFLKIRTHGILTMLILVPTLVFWIANPKSILWQIWTKKVKVVCFAWKLIHMLSRGCWFLFQH